MIALVLMRAKIPYVRHRADTIMPPHARRINRIATHCHFATSLIDIDIAFELRARDISRYRAIERVAVDRRPEKRHTGTLIERAIH